MAKTSHLQHLANTRKQPGIHAVVAVEDLSPTAYILRFERNGLEFEPGQHILLGLPGKSQMREYSIYSGNEDPYVEVLIREVKDGLVSRQLRKLGKGSYVKMEPPVGFFTLPAKLLTQSRFLFIASGTGIAPFHSFIRSNKNLKYTLLHGTRYKSESFGSEFYDPQHYIQCTSRDTTGTYHGRVSGYLRQHPVDDYAMVYLCGNYNMILDAMDILRKKGIPESRMQAEVYF